jgi:hypothetical protein
VITATRCVLSQISPEIAARLNTGSFWHSLGFARLWHTMGGREVVWVVSDKRKPVAAMSGVEFGRGPVVRFQAMPDGCYFALCPLTDDAVDSAKVIAALLDGLYHYGYVKIHLNDYFGQLTPTAHFTPQPQETLLVDISAPDWQPPDKALQSEIRKAQRDGVEAETFEASAHMKAFLQLMHATETRHGREPKYNDQFFAELARLAIEDKRVHWLQVMRGKEAAASHIYFVDGELALHWQAYLDKAHSALKPNQFLLYAAARRFAAAGVRILNLGSSGGAAESLVTFKEKWGGFPHQYTTWQHLAGLGRLL